MSAVVTSTQHSLVKTIILDFLTKNLSENIVTSCDYYFDSSRIKQKLVINPIGCNI